MRFFIGFMILLGCLSLAYSAQADSFNRPHSFTRAFDLTRAELGEPLLTVAVKLYRKHLPAGHPRTLKMGVHLARCWINLGHYARAERLLAQLTQEVRDGDTSHDLVLIESRIVLYEAWKRPEQAATWRAKRDAIVEIPR